MKPFNLEEALAGKLCITRDGKQAIIMFDKSKAFPKAKYVLGGYLRHEPDDNWRDPMILWTREGRYSGDYVADNLDIVGMYIEEQPEVTITIPAPVIGIQSGVEYWTFNTESNDMEIYSLRQYHPDFYRQRLEYGQVFKTKEDCQAFLDAMKGARR